jgi:transcriptional regulator with XRE-family HTH domain
MARPKKADRASVATETLALRLTEEDRAVLDRLVEAARASVADSGAELTAAGYVRGLIRREAKRLEAGEALPSRSSVPAPDSDGHLARTEKARNLVEKAKASGRSQAEIAKSVDVDPGYLSRWLSGKGPMAAKHIDALISKLGG